MQRSSDHKENHQLSLALCSYAKTLGCILAIAVREGQEKEGKC